MRGSNPITLKVKTPILFVEFVTVKTLLIYWLLVEPENKLYNT